MSSVKSSKLLLVVLVLSLLSYSSCKCKGFKDSVFDSWFYHYSNGQSIVLKSQTGKLDTFIINEVTRGVNSTTISEGGCGQDYTNITANKFKIKSYGSPANTDVNFGEDNFSYITIHSANQCTAGNFYLGDQPYGISLPTTFNCLTSLTAVGKTYNNVECISDTSHKNVVTFFVADQVGIVGYVNKLNDTFIVQ